MLSPIIKYQLYYDTCILSRTFLCHKNSKGFILIGQRYFHQKPSIKENQSNIARKANAPLSESFTSSWKSFHFPQSEKLFEYDNVNPDEWNLVYRIKWSTKLVYGFVYTQIVLLVGVLVVLYKVLFKGYRIRNTMIDSEDQFKLTMIGASLLTFGFTFFIVRAFPNAVLRGYYSSKYQRFMFIRPNLLTPWRIRKLICAPGMLETIQTPGLYRMQANCKIKDSKIFLEEKNFFYPAYFNALSGFCSASVISNIRFNPDIIFRENMKK